MQSDVIELSMLPRDFVVLDLKTTGLDSERHEIIEIGAMRVHVDTSTCDTFQVLVKPEKKVPKHITDLTGITQEMVDQDGEPIADMLPAFLEFISDLPLVTFNADFDMAFLQNAASRHGLVIANRYACALEMARRAWPSLPSYKLEDLAELGNLPTEGTHRALGDCKIALTIFTSAASILGNQIMWSKLPVEQNASHRAATTTG